ncbi:MAG: hypothetical protein OSB00_10855 [Sphingomonas bacterium]|nr:hypothetical protein [Sphingomonas bacterium]
MTNDPRAAHRPRPSPATIWLILTLVTEARRLPDIGNPLLDLDEQFYLLVGDRMLDGAIPYVDIWDRKPVGLFLIYAAARAPGGDPFVGYQILASLTLLATAGLVGSLARRIAGGWAGLAAGIVLLLWSEFLGGRGGQSPLFYNAAIAGAALVTCRALNRSDQLRCHGLVAMVLCGLAIQIKPTVVFEGVWFGVALLAAAWRAGWRGVAIARHAAALIGAALLPTLLALFGYATIGHAGNWWFATIVSIFHRGVESGDPIAARLTGIALMLIVPMAAAIHGATRLTGNMRWFLIGWAMVALIGVAAVPPYYNHYALPLVVPVAVLAGIGMAASRPLAVIVIAGGAALLWLSGYPHVGERAASRAALMRMAALVNTYRGTGCMFGINAPPALYVATGSCLPTRYPFSPHLTLTSEAGAIGVNQRAELIRVLAGRPTVIVTGPTLGGTDPRAVELVDRALALDYRRIGAEGDDVIWTLRQRPADNP